MLPFWVTVLSFGLPLGWLAGWVAALDLNLKNVGVSQNQAGYIGAVTICAACAAGLVASRLAAFSPLYHSLSLAPPLALSLALERTH